MNKVSPSIWHKSSYSNGSGGNCIETSSILAGAILVRDSKHTEGPVLAFPRGTWRLFLDKVREASWG
ncbi:MULTISPECIES: DUF397 domain-containing protein [Streptomyces]|uniref:DUF397 domain-containing protein n=2 Tax=Streptomyces rimosus subsp. rimosus TaxID=132474 RepID=L8EX82_STRR1|nr:MULTISPECIES: DUF397 domain-containing protein [Streptomyces]MYT48284.1 DUF397 domain-containing protein [Streptomyces sp. SID5471]QDA05911.1 DUF397 domain-containing protein [Streptomyces rimosus]QEV77186.1 DUF397 domain-containing protein [Streptomyces rimosus]QGY65139.1 DUF397 domain-containing protein [Streptomyces rimosus R6-500]QST82072.1 DUF397 domain-containing protein [Streptomyces rimosus subsp. rimosus ATCC 10970]